jgi:hypothetical protein
MKHMFRYVVEKNNSYFGREIMILTSQTQIIHSNIGVMLHCIMKESPQKSTFTTQNTPSSGELVFIYLLLRRIKKQYKLATDIRVCAVPIHFSGRGMQRECFLLIR